MTSQLETLLEVQEHDLALDRLRLRRATLPARGELESCERAIAQGERARDGERAEHATVAAEERRLDDESEALRERADDMNKRLYSGSVTSPRELQAMQADVEMLTRQRSDLEDTELEVMERREQLDARLAELDAQLAGLDAQREQLRADLGASEAEIDAEIAAEEAARAAVAETVGAALLADYERRRDRNRGAGAARLVGTTCQACHLTIPSTEAERIRRGGGADAAYCDNCGAILVP